MGIQDLWKNFTGMNLSEIKSDNPFSCDTTNNPFCFTLPDISVFEMPQIPFSPLKLPDFPVFENCHSVQSNISSDFSSKSWDEYYFMTSDFSIPNSNFSFNIPLNNFPAFTIPQQNYYIPLPIYQPLIFSTQKPDVGAASISDTHKQTKQKQNKKYTPVPYSSNSPHDKYFSQMLAFVFAHEGGYVNHRNDKGGRTNMGITQKTYDGYRKEKGLPVKHVKDITREEAIEIYHNIYVESGADKVSDPQLAMCIFDWANHSGAKNKTLQQAIKECNGDVNKFIQARCKFLHRRIDKDTSQEVFRKGWDNRINDLTSFVSQNLPTNYS